MLTVQVLAIDVFLNILYYKVSLTFIGYQGPIYVVSLQINVNVREKLIESIFITKKI